MAEVNSAMFQLKLNQLSMDLASHYPFLNDIIGRAHVIINHSQFQSLVLDDLCARVAKVNDKTDSGLHTYVREQCKQVSIKICVERLRIAGALMESSLPIDENHISPCTIHICQSWYEHIRGIQVNAPEYQRHVVLAAIKIIHEVLHCCTRVFCAYAALINPGLPKPKVTPTNIGRTLGRTFTLDESSSSPEIGQETSETIGDSDLCSIVSASPHLISSITEQASSSLITSKNKKKRKRPFSLSPRRSKSTRTIGDMGYGAEEILLGGRLFAVFDKSTDNNFHIIELRLDVHQGSILPEAKFKIGESFVELLWDMNKLNELAMLNDLKPLLDNPMVDLDNTHSPHLSNSSKKRPQIKRAYSDSCLALDSSSDADSCSEQSLTPYVDPNDPYVLYPAIHFRQPPPSSKSSRADHDINASYYDLPWNYRV